MAVNDDLLLQALGAGGADIILRQGVDHGGAHRARHAGKAGEHQHDDGQRHIVHTVSHLGKAGIGRAGRLGAADREQPELDGKDVNEHDADQIGGQAVADDGDGLDAAVDRLAAVNGAVDAQRDGNGQRQNR